MRSGCDSGGGQADFRILDSPAPSVIGVRSGLGDTVTYQPAVIRVYRTEPFPVVVYDVGIEVTGIEGYHAVASLLHRKIELPTQTECSPAIFKPVPPRFGKRAPLPVEPRESSHPDVTFFASIGECQRAGRLHVRVGVIEASLFWVVLPPHRNNTVEVVPYRGFFRGEGEIERQVSPAALYLHGCADRGTGSSEGYGARCERNGAAGDLDSAAFLQQSFHIADRICGRRPVIF